MTTANMCNNTNDSELQRSMPGKSMWATPLVFVSLILMSICSRAEPLLNGLAISTELGKERFIAALYTDDLSKSPVEVLNSTVRRSMELKIVADSLSARSLNNMWIEGIAINNSSSALEKQANNTLKLANLIRKRLVQGDTLRFNFETGKGVDVLLDGVTLGNIPSDDFFNMLLRTWIGSVPLSSEFRDQLLAAGDIDGDLIARYNAIQPQAGRTDVVASWIENEPEKSSTTVAAAPEPAKPRVRLDAPKPKLSLGELDAPPAREEKPSVAKQEPKPQPAATPTTPAAEPAQAPQQAAAPAPKPEPKETPKPAEAQNTVALASQPVTESVEEEEEEEAYDIQSILDRQYYVSELNNISRKALRYPRIAQQRQQEGSIRASVVIDRQGKVISSTLVEESRHRSLNREVLKMIERVDPYPPIPESIKGESFEFTLPIGFRLAD